MINVYADQNFLSSCAENPAWRDVLVRARDKGTVALVLSPLHFLEIGKADRPTRESIMSLVDALSPCWVYNYANTQLREFTSAWDQFHGHQAMPFVPFCTLHEAAAAMYNISPSRIPKVELRKWIETFSSDPDEINPLAELKEAMAEQETAASSNQTNFKNGQITAEMLRQTERAYIALQLVRRSVGDAVDRKILYRHANQVMENRMMAAQIDAFIAQNGIAALRCYQLERALTENIWAGEARLNPSRLVDRQHATAAIPYCDVFVTDDVDLTKRCKAAKNAVRFPTATIQQGETFIRSLEPNAT